MAGFDHRIILAGQTPDIVDTFNKSYDVGRKRAIEDQAIERSNRLNESINSWDKSKPLSQHLIESGFADEGYDYAKKDAEVKKMQGDATKTDYESRLKMIDIAGRATQELLAHPALSKDAIKQKADEYFQAGLTTPEMYQKQINMLPSLPDDPAQLRKHIESQVMGLMEAKEQMKYQRPDANAQLNAQTQMRNQDLDYSLGQQNYSLNSRKADFDNQMDMSRFNLDRQNKEFSQKLDLSKQELEQQKRRDALGGKGKPPTEFQGKSALYANRAQEAENILNSIDYSPAAIGTKESLSNTPLIGGMLGAGANALMSEDSQKAEQAQRNFVNAILRQESGAVISPAEFENAKKQYFPAVGDTEALIKQKAANRMTAIQSLKNNAEGVIDTSIGGRGASDGWDDGHVTMQAQKLGTDPAKVKAFLQWKASQGR